MSSNLDTLDNLLIFLYFAIVLLIGLAVSRARGNQKTQYFLAGKSLGWIVIGSSLFATSVSSEHLVGLAGAGQPILFATRPTRLRGAEHPTPKVAVFPWGLHARCRQNRFHGPGAETAPSADQTHRAPTG